MLDSIDLICEKENYEQTGSTISFTCYKIKAVLTVTGTETLDFFHYW